MDYGKMTNAAKAGSVVAETAVGLNETAIRSMFRSYVEGTGGKPRHTKEAYLEAGKYSAFVTGAISGNGRLQEELYQRMMNCAVEYEESGFVAGVRFALRLPPEIQASLIAGNPTTHLETEAAFKQPTNGAQKGNSATPPKDTLNSGASAANTGAAISSKQIAEMFETSNAKVVNRIEEMILPRLDAQSKRFFRMDVERTTQHRRYKVYYMNKAACDLYLEEIESHKKYVNIAGGIVKMRELMKTVFPVASDNL